jgi:subtilisin family serine protease
MDCGIASVPAAGIKYDVEIPQLENPTEILTREEMAERMGGQTHDWGHEYLKSESAYPTTKGRGATIFVLDTAGKYDHDELKARTLHQYAKNFTDAKTDDDMHGHSTHVAGIAAAGDNDVGVIGVAPEANLVPLKVLNDSGSGQYAWIASAIRYVADIQDFADRKIISMSLGGGSTNKEVTDAIDYAISKGVFIVVAAGNNGHNGDRDTVAFPGNYEPVITVASLDKSGSVSSFSSAGKAVDVAAPGGDVYSTFRGNAYAKMSGTSMATPQVAGVVALILTANSSITTQQQLADFLAKGAVDLTTPGEDNLTGAGAPIVSGYFPG